MNLVTAGVSALSLLDPNGIRTSLPRLLQFMVPLRARHWSWRSPQERRRSHGTVHGSFENETCQRASWLVEAARDARSQFGIESP